MKEIHNARELREVIAELEEKQSVSGQVLKEQIMVLAENVKPSAMLKYAVREMGSVGNLLEKLGGTSLGMAAGYVSRRTITGRTGGFFRNILGTMLQYGITNYIINNPEKISALILGIKETFFRGSEDDTDEDE
ncbi:MAG: hypothetical protein RBS37_00040 [Bacteroidales bacterium]|jgi:hypothetical protein|nr:hypothetical protein [Bacteroidales bacterium]